MKCSSRSVTNLADLTIGLPGSLNVRVLCSMYRTSHINEERRLYMKGGKREGELKKHVSSNIYETGEKALHTSSNVLSHSSFFFYTRSENMHALRCCPMWPAEGSFLWFPALMLCPALMYTNGFENIQLTLLGIIQLWCFSFYT